MKRVNCPQCGKLTDFEGNEYRPFCSDRCKTLDLGAWASGDYSIPASLSDLTEDDLEEVRRMAEEGEE